VASKPVQNKRASQVPSIDKKLLISSSGTGTVRDPRDLQMQKKGAPNCHPARPYWSEVRSLTLDGFEQAPQITRVRDDEGTRIRAFPRAHLLEGASHVVFESQQGQLAGGIPPRESFRALGP
jgi:hypothetical protein